LLPETLLRLVHLFARFPGVGEKTAQRFVLHLVTSEEDLAEGLAHELGLLRSRVRPCEQCGHMADASEAVSPILCSICRDSKRDGRVLCIVARVQDLLAIERSGAMRGRYFVLGKLLSPLEGVGPDDLPLAALHHRLSEAQPSEVVIATPPSVDGEATALLLARELGQRGIRITRIASGVPHGGDLEFADQITLGRAIEGRKQLTG
jgi:recombination protein RecR